MKTTSKAKQFISQGYHNQLKCFRSMKKGRESMQVINECLKRTSDENTMYELLSDALDIAANLQGKESKFLTSKKCSQNSRLIGLGKFVKSQIQDRNAE